MFILLKGVSKDEAFKIGKDICEAVTQDNPVPIKLKFEKVFYRLVNNIIDCFRCICHVFFKLKKDMLGTHMNHLNKLSLCLMLKGLKLFVVMVAQLLTR